MKSKFMLIIAIVALAITSCDDDTSYLGSTLTAKVDSLKISADTFNVTTRSIKADSVLSRNSIGYLGKVKDPETGAYITGDFMTQFHTIDNYEFPKSDSIISKIDGKVVADSVEIRLYYTDYYGDSLNAMKMTTYELASPVEEGHWYYSNYSPEEKGLIRTDGIKKQKVYTIHDLNVRDSIRSLSTYNNNIRIMLNDPYTDKDGVTYNNYGTYVMRKFYENKDYFKNSYNFIHNVCPGFYFKTTNSLGSMAYVYVSQLNVYFRYISSDSIYDGTASFSGTEEVLQTTKITNDTKTINKLVSDNTCSYLKSPAGIFTELTLPVEDIFNNHENDTLNTAKVVLTRVNNKEQNSYNFDIPSSLLMIQKDSLYSFFENAKVADSKTSYITTYSSTYNTYTFSNISGLVTSLNSIKTKGLAADANWVSKHPDWNKVVIIPVTTTYNSSSELTKVVHDMSLTSTKLVGGSENSRDPIKISVIYSKFNLK
jgi:hypothetical protein